MLTSATRGEMLTPNPRGWGQLPNPNECNSTLQALLGVLTPTLILTYTNVLWWYGI